MSALRYWQIEFPHQLDLLERAFKAAVEEALKDQMYLTADGVEIERRIGAGPPVDVVEVDWYLGNYDGYVDTTQWLYEADMTLRIVSESFIISLWHFWERQVAAIMIRLSPGNCDFVYKHAKVIGWLKEQGLDPDAKRLQELMFLAHTLKHFTGPSSIKLQKMRPDLFLRPGGDGQLVTAQHLWMEPPHFDDYLAVVRRSGPGLPVKL